MATNRKIRRGLLLGMTLLTILLVVIGSLFLEPFLESSRYLFGIYWAICFVCTGIVLMLAFIDMRKVRQEYRSKQVELDAELAKIVSDTEEIAREAESNKIE